MVLIGTKSAVIRFEFDGNDVVSSPVAAKVTLPCLCMRGIGVGEVCNFN
jgi:hypothetical protein